MKDVVIKFLGLGINNKYQASVTIYDSFNKVVYRGNTYNGLLNICLKENNIYRLKTDFMGDHISTNIYIGNNNCYCFRFKNSILDNIQRTNITFLLTDYYYDNLVIERGEIILWQR